MVFGAAAGTELYYRECLRCDLWCLVLRQGLELYYKEGLRCDLWCFVLRQGLEPVPAEYQPFDRVTCSSICVKFINLRTMK